MKKSLQKPTIKENCHDRKAGEPTCKFKADSGTTLTIDQRTRILFIAQRDFQIPFYLRYATSG